MSDDAIVFMREQQELIDATESLYVEACPGAGKTKTIVERFLRRLNADPRRGVGLISFTNAVVDEARSRCSSQVDLMRSPNFIGTIDRFINHFVVGPLLTSRENKPHTFRSVWQQTPGSVIRAQRVAGQAMMDWFTFTIAGDATLDPRKAPLEKRGAIRKLEPWACKRLEGQASRQWKQNIERGILDAAASRLYLMEFIRDPTTRSYLRELLAARFYEVIVDEVQDCSREDAALLDLLLDAGVRLVLVGDPQQAIYGFRGGSANELKAVLDAVKQGTRFDGNFRSSPAICGAVNGLRATDLVDRSVGSNKEIAGRVKLLRYNRSREVPTRLRAIIAAHSIPEDALVVLAHGTSKARACAGGGASADTSATSKLVALATAVHTIQDESATSRARASALIEFETGLHHLASEEHAALTLDDFLAEIDVSARVFRERCLRLASALSPPYGDKPSAFKAELLAQTDHQRIMRWKASSLRTPNGDKWTIKPASNADALRYSTIHGYKGLQARAVAVVVAERSADMSDDDDGLTQWTKGISGEARNVLYVGVSRAEELLIVVAHDAVFDQVKANFDRDQVNYEVVT